MYRQRRSTDSRDVLLYEEKWTEDDRNMETRKRERER